MHQRHVEGVSVIFFLIYAVLLFVVGGAAFGVYLLLRRHSRLAAYIAAGIAGGGAVLVFPLPIHGGFTLVGEALLHDFGAELRSLRHKREQSRDLAFVENYAKRFAGTLPADTLEVAPFSQAGGLLWVGPFEAMADGLPAAKRVCSQFEPRGYWALPTEGDYYQYWRETGTDARRRHRGRFTSYLVDEQMRLELPTTVITLGEGASDGQRSRQPPPRVHCVARTAQAPLQGYLKGDVPLSAWNEFQLAK